MFCIAGDAKLPQPPQPPQPPQQFGDAKSATVSSAQPFAPASSSIPTPIFGSGAAAAAVTSTATTAPMFSFGTATTTATPSSIFTFGATQQPSSNAKEQSFSFGAQPAKQPAFGAPQPSVFGEQQAPSMNFGSPAPAFGTAPTDTSSLFNFGPNQVRLFIVYPLLLEPRIFTSDCYGSLIANVILLCPVGPRHLVLVVEVLHFN